MSDKKTVINIDTGTIFRAIAAVLLIIFLYFVRDVLIVILFSVVIASAVEPATVWFQKRKIPRTPSVIIIYLMAFITLAAIFYMMMPIIFSEFSSFSSNISILLEKPSQSNILNEIITILPSSMSGLFQEFASQAFGYMSGLATGFFHTTVFVFGGVLSFILIVVLSFYLSVQEKGIENFLRIVTPLRYENYIIDLWSRSRNKIGKWLQGQILLGAIVGILIFLGLMILGVEYALTFALLAAVFELIPVFGPILSAVPPIIIALSQDPVLALKVLVLCVIVQQFENHLIYPLVVRKIVGIPPILTIIALVVGAKLAGFPGILLSVPLVTVLVEIMNDIELKKRPIAGQ